MGSRLCGTLAILALVACEPTAERLQIEPDPVVYTTFYPTTWLTQRIVGDAIEVVCPLPAGQDPYTWRPSREVLQAYQRAGLIVLNGADFEPWAKSASLPTSRVVDVSKGFADQFVTFEDVTHSHGGGDLHQHAGVDGHVWMDPTLQKEQARAILAAVQSRFAEHAAEFDANAGALFADLDALDARWREVGEGLAKAQVFCSHQAYAYPARRYGFEVTDLHLDPEADLDSAALERLGALPKGDGKRILLWESAPKEGLAERIEREFGLTSVVFSPAESQPASGDDFLMVMRRNLDAVR